MDCSRVLSQLASLSADDLTPQETAAIERHLAECPPCQGQWVLFEQTLVTLSKTSEIPLSAEISQRMWLVCLEHAQQKQAVLKAPKTLEDNGIEDNTDEGQVVARPPFRLQPKRANWADDARIRDTRGVLFAGRALGFGWAALGGAALALAATYFLMPAPTSAPAAIPFAVQPLPSFKPNDPGPLVSFQLPSRAAASLVDHHAAMGFDPFSDHVASSLVSSVALQSPSQAAPPARR